MKRIAIALAVVFLLIFTCLFLGRSPEIAPCYVAIRTQPVGPFISVTYDWNGTVPIRDGKFWVCTHTWTEPVYAQPRSYLYDLNQGKVIGEISNAFPVLANIDQTRFLCQQFDLPIPSMKQRIADFMTRHSFGIFKRFRGNVIETFWILDIRDNSAVKTGELSQAPGGGSSWVPAPGFRFAVNIPTSVTRGRQFLICDLEAKTIRKINFVGFVRGWWDDHTLVIRDSADKYLLFDVLTRKSATLLAIADISRFLQDQGIATKPAELTTLFQWSGNNYAMYVTGSRTFPGYSNADFLIKVRHDPPRFELVSTNFSHRPLGSLDTSATHYLFSGESGAPGKSGDGSVWLRDLSNNSERILVPPDSAGQYALARMYSNTVIYWRNRVLWRVDINTTNSSRLFPPLAN